MSSSNEQLQWLFTDDRDPRALSFAELFLGKADIKNEQGYDFMRSELFENKQSGMQPGDIHNEFIDFLVKVAQYHKKINDVGDSNDSRLQGLKNNVIDKWDSLNNDVKDMYRKYINFGFLDTGVGSSISVNTWQFANDLPTLPDDIKNLWYTSTSGVQSANLSNIRQANQPMPQMSQMKQMPEMAQSSNMSGGGNGNSQALKNIYLNVVQGADAGLGNLPSGYPSQSYSVNTKKWLCERLARVSKASVVDGSSKYDDLDYKNYDLWYWDGKEYVKVVDGKISKEGCDENCNSLGIQNQNDSQCKNFINECLLNQDDTSLEKCINNYVKTGFFDNVSKELSNMHPMVAVSMLKRFGFKEVGASGNKEMEDVDSWLQHTVKDNIRDTSKSKELHKAIKQNYNLINYLNLVSQYVNANPAILNKGYVAPPQGVNVVSSKPMSSFAKSLGINSYRQISRDQTLKYQLGALGQLLKMRQLSQQSPIILPGFQQQQFSPNMLSMGTQFMTVQPGFGLTRTVQMGGGKCDTIIRSPIIQNSTGSSLVKQVISELINNLRQKNVNLDSSYEQKISENIKQLSSLENELLRTVCLLDEASRAVRAFGVEGTLNRNQLEKLVRRASKITDKKSCLETKLVELCQKLASH